VTRYRGRISGSLLDCIDLQIEVPSILQKELMHQKTISEKSSVIRKRVTESHQHQLNRQGKTNSRLSVKEIDQHCALDTTSENLLKQAISRLNLSARVSSHPQSRANDCIFSGC